jgi:hypothetical protein
MTLILNNEEVAKVLTMDDCLEVLEQDAQLGSACCASFCGLVSAVRFRP